ncbi:hypothetical protein BDV26DRAFT_262286 [Aspergillus bertholletiae]|uniref:Uncharacterized protein n=1 Tax=Aspergillus bertholletiae TaxID=1226010 RepID=A0A5N7B8P1_9EURO|nr:hypothetical protein BDV26DRAFT_262286 [Aspergillus bertholletiae]
MGITRWQSFVCSYYVQNDLTIVPPVSRIYFSSLTHFAIRVYPVPSPSRTRFPLPPMSSDKHYPPKAIGGF